MKLTAQEIFDKAIEHFKRASGNVYYNFIINSRYFNEDRTPCCGIGAVIEDKRSVILDAKRLDPDILPYNNASISKVCAKFPEIAEYLDYENNKDLLSIIQRVSDSTPAPKLKKRCQKIAEDFALKFNWD